MTKERKILGVLAVAGAMYLIWRLQVAGDGPVTFVSPWASLFPERPSPTPETATPAWAVIGYDAPKLPGNLSSVPTLPASRGTAVNPVGPPDVVTLTAQPAPSPFLGEGYQPNLGDPNFSMWNYLASTPPDLSWGIYVR